MHDLLDMQDDLISVIDDDIDSDEEDMADPEYLKTLNEEE